MNMLRLAAAAVVFGGLSAPLMAQNDNPDSPPVVAQPAPTYQPSWSSPQIAQMAGRLTGTWRTDEPSDSLKGADGKSVPVYMVMSVAPAPVEGMSDTLYVETARSDSPWSPYRRAIFQFYTYKDHVRLRTYELAVGQVSDGVFDGMFAAPDQFPDLKSDELVATMDIDLTATPSGFTGSSPYPFPTGVGGAVEMTSSVTLEGDTLTVADRGFDAKGKVAWGAGDKGHVIFERSQSIVSVNRREDGMIILDYGGASGPIVANGDRMSIHYEGFLKNLNRFDTSYDRGQPFVFAYPPGTRAITGWGIGMDGFAEGGRRKLIIPGFLGYGVNGNPRAGIPGDATLYFNVHFVHLEKGEPAPEPTSTDEPADHSGHSHEE